MTNPAAALDDPQALTATDPQGMLAAVESFAAQWEASAQRSVGLEPLGDDVSSVVVCGMGGSGIAGDVARAILEPTVRVPVRLVRGHQIPGYVGASTLVVCLSYSGNTSETVACFEEAASRGARLVAIAGGGELAARARDAGALLLQPEPGLIAPRAALPSLTVPLLAVLERAGVAETSGAIAAASKSAAGAVRRYGRDVPLEKNPAKRVAAAIDGRFPVVWGSEGTQAVAALRWKNQLAENSKLPASVAFLPELCHNDIVGLHHGHRAFGDAILLVLRIEGGHPGQDARLKAAVSLVQDGFGAVEVVAVGGSTPLERLIESVVLGDFVSVYAAVLRGVDPTPIEAIAALKAALD